MKPIILAGVVSSILFASPTPTAASSPGQPYECADWEILAPGLTCSVKTQWTENKVFGTDTVVDNAGRIIRVTLKIRPNWICGSFQAYWAVIEAFDGTAWTELIRLGDRCVVDLYMDRPLAGEEQGMLAFDPHAGRLYVFLAAKVNQQGGSGSLSRNSPPWNQKTIFAFDGFATTFELQQTYEPPQALSIQVPARPEGLAGADHFDTYWGSLGGPIDLASAQPLHCGYPAAPPVVGERIEFADSLATPPLGSGYWYLTAVTYQGETRAGRRAVHGQLTGRNAGLLPACN
jgi:hypothetical protein